MNNKLSAINIMNSVVPITRFNKGEANKIFDEVSKDGEKVVFKNNKPICILTSPEKYIDMIEKIDIYNNTFNEIISDYKKIITQNGTPIGILLSPEKYEEMMGIIEKYNEIMEDEKRAIKQNKAAFFARYEMANENK